MDVVQEISDHVGMVGGVMVMGKGGVGLRDGAGGMGCERVEEE